MGVIGHTADLYSFAGMILYNAGKVFVKFGFPRADHWQTTLGCENNMKEKMCMGHGGVTRVSHAFRFLDILLHVTLRSTCS